MYRGPRCTYAVGVLVRCLVLFENTTESFSSTESRRAERIDKAVAALATAVNDADSYCSEYAAKQQPRLANLYATLAKALRGLKLAQSETAITDDA